MVDETQMYYEKMKSVMDVYFSPPFKSFPLAYNQGSFGIFYIIYVGIISHFFFIMFQQTNKKKSSPPDFGPKNYHTTKNIRVL